VHGAFDGLAGAYEFARRVDMAEAIPKEHSARTALAVEVRDRAFRLDAAPVEQRF